MKKGQAKLSLFYMITVRDWLGGDERLNRCRKETVGGIVNRISGFFLQRDRCSQIHEDELTKRFILPRNARFFSVLGLSRSSA
jgi:hypothetical protein